MRENFPDSLESCFKFWDFGQQEKQTCREPWVNTALNLAPTFCVGCIFEIERSSLLEFFWTSVHTTGVMQQYASWKGS